MTQTDKRIIKTRARVLNSAQALFLKEGISGVTHLTVAAHAGVGRKTIYRHWPTVNDLLADALATASFPPMPDTGDVAADLRQHLTALAAALREGPLDYILYALNERAAHDAELRAVRDRLTQDGCSGITRLMDRAAKKGLLRPGFDPNASAAKLEGPVFYFALVRRCDLPDDLIDDLVDAFLAEHSAQERKG